MVIIHLWRRLFVNNYQKVILEYLLNKYERSVLSKQGSALNLQIKVKIKKLFPKYDDSDYYDQRIMIDEASNYLKRNELVDLICHDDEIELIILNLNLSQIKKGYNLIGREYKLDYHSQAITYLQNLNLTVQWIDDFRIKMIQRIKDFKNVNRYLLLEEANDIIDVFRVLEAMHYQKDEVSFRKFSITVLKDSKRLEELKNKIVNIINDFYEITFHNEDELFSHFNVIKNPGFVYLKGNINIKLYDQVIDVGALHSPFSLTTENIKILKILSITDVNILTVENLTSFYDLNLKNTLIIYLGGYHNTLRRELLIKIFSFNKKLNFYHFGDIDAGGFYIYQHLVEKTKIPFNLLAMDKETLIKYQKYTKKLTANDRKRLMKLREILCKDTIDYMLEHNCKLEQEIVVLNDVIKGNEI